MTLLPLALYSAAPFWGALLGGTPAFAGGFEPKSMRAPLSAIEVERPLILGRGWLELGLRFDDHVAAGAWSATGEPVDWDATRWIYTTERLDLRYGISRRAELYWTVPFHYVRLTNKELGTDTSTFGLGDAGFGWRLEWLRRDAPLTSLITDLSVEVPSGTEAPGSLIGGPNTVSNFVLSNGTMSSGLTVRGKQQIGALACTLGGGYVRHWSAVTQFDVEVEEYQFLGRFKPGDEVTATFQPLLQLGPVAAAGELRFGWRALARTGTTAGGVIPDGHLDPIPGSSGWSLVVTPSVTVNASRGVDVVASAGIPLRGEDLTFFPLEELTPTRGVTWSGAVELRY